VCVCVYSKSEVGIARRITSHTRYFPHAYGRYEYSMYVSECVCVCVYIQQ